MAETVIITIGKDGRTRIETKGFKGAACHKATADLERDLGGATSDHKTAEFHQAAAQPQAQKARG